jgi:cyclopropane fatty-acyl-phospholipid synthase-like methyltransferase
MRHLAQTGLLRAYAFLKRQSFESSSVYWQRRYVRGETSGHGSYHRLAAFKAAVLNEIVAERSVETVIELGCGDGAQLWSIRYPSYVGVDVSPAAIVICQKKFADDTTKNFITLDEFRKRRPTADLCVSLDVIYHLVEDAVFHSHLRELFDAAQRLVAVYSSNSERIMDPVPHVRHREFTRWVAQHAPEWQLLAKYKNPYPYRWWNRKHSSHCDLFLFERAP